MPEASESSQVEDTPTLPSFEEMPLSDDVKQALADMGYIHPAAVQHAVYDPAIRGIDLVVQARTGTGKTAAFGIPLVDQMIKRSLRAPQALILTPTRELALQVARELERIGAKRGIKPACVYGGAPMQRQIDAIREGAQIIAGTPGRVLDHLRRGTLSAKDIRILILDESDEMLSMGFERELHAIVDFLPNERQTLLFSATLPPEIVRMASNRLRDPEFIYLSGDNVGALEIDHFVYMVTGEKHDNFVRIIEVEDPESALIFCNTRDETELVAGALARAGYDADWLNGDLPQSEREKVMGRSKEGKLRFLVATDVAARGIDISHLTHVINFDFPESSEVYVHRTGRTGRMGRTGTAISLITPQDIGALYYLRLTYKIRPFEKQIPSEGEMKTRAQADIVGMLAEAFASKPAHPEDLELARRLITHDRGEHILAGLLRNHLGDRMKAQDAAGEARRARLPHPAPKAADLDGSDAESSPRAPRPPRGRTRATARRGERPDAGPPPEQERGPRKRRSVESPAERYVRPNEEPTAEPAPAVAAQPAPSSTETLAVSEAVVESPVVPPNDERDTEPPPPPNPRKGATESKASGGRRTRERRERTEFDLDLPRYEVSSMTDDEPQQPAPEPEPAPAQPVGHASLADWTPPPEEGDDQPILGDEESERPPPRRDFDAVGEDEIEIFVNVGRKDGVRPGDFARALGEAPGVDRDDVGRIRIRDRHTFVAVRSDVFEAAIAALHGRSFGGRIASAEQARPRDPVPSED